MDIKVGGLNGIKISNQPYENMVSKDISVVSNADWNPSQGAQTFQMIGVGDYKNAQESDTVIIRISGQYQ